MPPDPSPPDQRLAQGAVLVVGAVLLLLVVGEASSRFYLVPGALGLILLAAAFAGGPRGGYWAPALVLLGFGIACIVLRRADVGLPSNGVLFLGTGIGALVAAMLARAGVGVESVPLATTIVAIGLIEALRDEVHGLTELAYYVVALALVGLASMVVGALQLRDRRGNEPDTRASAG